MKDFIEKWNSEPKFKTKVQLGLYTLFVVVVAIFAISTKGETPTDITDFENKENHQTEELENNFSIAIPMEYEYTKNITINEKNYQYIGYKKEELENITKIIDNKRIEYLYQNDNYYRNEEGSYILTTKEEIYDKIEQNYLNLETINKYLSKSTKKETEYLVYLKDIILGNDSQDYITIKKEENKISINYTSLMNLFDKTINKCLVEVIIKEIE